MFLFFVRTRARGRALFCVPVCCAAFFRGLASVLLPGSVPAEHRFCINLLKAYGALSAVLLVSDLISFGAILSQVS